MKKIIFGLLVLISASATAQYTPMFAKGYEYKYLKADSGLVIPVRDTFHTSFTDMGSMVLRPADSSLYIYKHRWTKLAIDSAGLGSLFSNKVDSVKILTDTLFYYINGVAHGSVFTVSSAYPTSIDFDVSTGVLTINRNGLSAITKDLDGRYDTIGHEHVAADIQDFTTAGRNLISAGSGLSYNSSTGVMSYPGAGAGGTVTSVSRTNGYGISASVANATTTPNITIAADTTSSTGLVSKDRLGNAIAGIPLSRFGIEDVYTPSNRALNLGSHYLDITAGDSTYTGVTSDFTQDLNGFALFSQSDNTHLGDFRIASNSVGLAVASGTNNSGLDIKVDSLQLTVNNFNATVLKIKQSTAQLSLNNNDYQYLPLFVNGVPADSTGNITVSTGSGFDSSIYNSDGALTGNRTVTVNGGSELNFGLGSDPTNNYVKLGGGANPLFDSYIQDVSGNYSEVVNFLAGSGAALFAGTSTISNKIQARTDHVYIESSEGANTTALDISPTSLNISVAGNTPAAGKVLTSDASGNATWETPASSGGSVTDVSVTSANGFAGTVATSTTTPAITLSTTVTGILKGNGTAISAATAGTDYVTGSSTNTFTNKGGNISQWTNDANYITTSGARTAISLTTTGSSGAATYNNTTGVLNVPNYGAAATPNLQTVVNQTTGYNTVDPPSGLTFETYNQNNNHYSSIDLDGLFRSQLYHYNANGGVGGVQSLVAADHKDNGTYTERAVLSTHDFDNPNNSNQIEVWPDRINIGSKYAGTSTTSNLYLHRLPVDNTSDTILYISGLKVYKGLKPTSPAQVYPGAGIAVSTGTAWGTSLTDNSANWNTAYTDRLKWDGGATGLTASTGRTSLGLTTWAQNLVTTANPSAIRYVQINADNSVTLNSAGSQLTALGGLSSSTAASTYEPIVGFTTLGRNIATQTNPSAITFPRYNADNSVSALSAAAFRTAIGAGTGDGTVTAIGVTTANGVSGSSSGGTTPNLTISLGAITPSSVAASGTVTGSNLSGTHTGTSSGTNTGDQTITLTGDVTGSGTGSFATTLTRQLTPTAVKTANYTAVANDYVPVDLTSGSVTVTLPNAPADKTIVGVKLITTSGANTVSIATAGTDVLNKTGGSTTGTLSILNQGAVFQYKSSTGIWYAIGTDMPLSGLDARFQPLDADLTTIAGLTATTDNFMVGTASAWASRTPAQAKTSLSLNNVENTALSTWAGSSNITTLGTLTSLTMGGTLALGTNSITGTGSIATTGSRITKGWFTDIESTNMPTVGGTSLTTVAQTFQNKTITNSNNVLGGVTMTLGSDASNDMYYRNSSGILTRFASGNDGVVITSGAGVPSVSSTIPTATQSNITRTGTITSGTWNGTTTQNTLNIYSALGSAIKGESVINSTQISSNLAFTSQTARFVVVYLPQATTLTGVKWYQNTQGVYTSNNYNGVGLYTYSGGTLTLVASSTDDGTIWKAASSTWASKAFSSTYVAAAGVYYVAMLWSSSATTTAPAVGVAASSSAGQTIDFTNSAKLFGSVASLTALPSTQAMSSVTASTAPVYVALY